ncbi:MAG: uroporphyrinogen decarboxylase [Lactobacillus sp.]|jgi:uroporphyrinogen decarboxylase|nr:uroporphyrinogen decarboxylase [Lactobacillus sp.]
MTNKRDILLQTLDNQPADTILAGFWHHYLADERQQVFGFRQKQSIADVVAAQQRFYDEIHPDFTKIMSDNFFLLPNLLDVTFNSPADLRQIKPVPANHPWYQDQVAAIKAIVDHYQGDIGSFYNIFSPWYQLRLRFEILDQDPVKIYDFFAAEPALFGEVLNQLAQDLSELVTRLIQEAGIVGIYLCVQQPQDPRITKDLWQQYVVPSEKLLLNAAQAANDGNMLHICGFAGARNNLADYTDYPAKAINFASYVEGVSLAQGKKLFGNRAILGGFDNTEAGLYYRGTEAQIKAETKRLLQVNGRQGILLGADCSIPFDTPDARANWVSAAANSEQ